MKQQFKAVKMGNWIAIREYIPRGRYMPDGRGSWVTVELCTSESEARERVQFWTARELQLDRLGKLLIDYENPTT